MHTTSESYLNHWIIQIHVATVWDVVSSYLKTSARYFEHVKSPISGSLSDIYHNGSLNTFANIVVL